MAPILQGLARGCANAPQTRPVHANTLGCAGPGRRAAGARHGRLPSSGARHRASAGAGGGGGEANTSSPASARQQPEASFSGRTEGGGGGGLATFAEVQAAAAARGLALRLTQTGPFFSITCRQGDDAGEVLAEANGFVAPLFGLMHIDTLRILTRGLGGDEGERVRGGALGLSLLVGGAVFAHGLQAGCRKAEILAINDEDAWHDRLVRFYRFYGFRPVCIVGDQGIFRDLPHMLVWGGVGTRMDADVEAMLRRWTPAIRQRGGGPAGLTGAV